MSLKLVLQNLDEIPSVARQILEYSLPHKKFLFFGEMGTGKTTLIKELSLQLGVKDIVNSPTFSIINEYSTLSNGKIYHFDFYRIEDEKEAFQIGCEEYLFGEDYCFIEWPDRIPNLIADDMVNIKIQLNENKRFVEIII